MHRYWDDMDGSMGMNPMSQFITRPRVSVPDDARKEQAKTWDFIWDDAGACWRCWRCLVTVQQFKNLKRHYGGVKCRQRSRTLACQSSRQMLRAGGFKVRHAGCLVETPFMQSCPQNTGNSHAIDFVDTRALGHVYEFVSYILLFASTFLVAPAATCLDCHLSAAVFKKDEKELLQTEPEDAIGRPVDMTAKMQTTDVATADPLYKKSRPELPEQEYSMEHAHHTPMQRLRQEGHSYEVAKPPVTRVFHHDQTFSSRPSQQQSSITAMLSASSYDFLSSSVRTEPDSVVMPMTDSGEIDRLAVLCHCAYASQFSENPEDIFKYACVDVKPNQSGERMRDSCTPEMQGPFPQATSVRFCLGVRSLTVKNETSFHHSTFSAAEFLDYRFG